MMQVLASITIVLATIISIAFLVPQLVKLVRTGDHAGISGSWPMLGVVINTSWVVYLVNQDLAGAAISTGVMVFPYTYIAWKLASLGVPMGFPLLRGLAVVALFVGSFLIGGWPLFGGILGVSYAVQMTPAVWTAYRTWAPSGLEPRTWLLGTLEGVLWGYYGWFHSDSAVMIFAVIAFVGSLSLLVRHSSTKHRTAEVLS